MKKKFKFEYLKNTINAFIIMFLLINVSIYAIIDYRISFILMLVSLVYFTVANKLQENKDKNKIVNINKFLQDHFYSSGVNQESTNDIRIIMKILKKNK